MPRRAAATRRAGPDATAGHVQDSVDRIVAEWGAERPDLAVGPVEVLTRLSRVCTRVDDELAAVFAHYDLSVPIPNDLMKEVKERIERYSKEKDKKKAAGSP